MNFPLLAYIDNTTECDGPFGKPTVIAVKRGETGFYPIYIDRSADYLNKRLGVSRETAEAMHVCSITGVWPSTEPVPAPATMPRWDLNGRGYWNESYTGYWVKYHDIPVVQDIQMDNLHTLRIPRTGQNPDMICGAEYVGPLSAWKGKTAMLHNLVAVQFDDRGQYMAWGWHLFNASDWKVPETRPLFQALAQAAQARHNCIANGNGKEGDQRWQGDIKKLVDEHMPSGSGFDAGTELDYEASGNNKLVFLTSFHHMDGNGVYSGWTEHQVVVTPSLSYGFDIRVTGPNRNDIKEYIAEAFHEALKKKV